MSEAKISKWYRTLVKGKLVQKSGLTVGGSTTDPTGADLQCHQDGQGRLTIPGTSLAGALVETTARICPDIVDPRPNARLHVRYRHCELDRLTGKSRDGRPKARYRQTDEPDFYQSLWYFYPCHVAKNHPIEQRQGVGIRQATGAAAIDQRALFDHEVVPPGTAWDFMLEIDSLRAEARAEALTLLALLDWAQDRCWLGASAARGAGWLCLEGMELLRIPLTIAAVDAWPTNLIKEPQQLWNHAKSITGCEYVMGEGKIRKVAVATFGEIPTDRFRYLTIDACLVAGKRADGFGLDAFSVGGHNAQPQASLADRLLGPHGQDQSAFLASYKSDAPVVTTCPVSSTAPSNSAEPFIPGSGIRGPLRHATSRRARGLKPFNAGTPDPNEKGAAQSSLDPVSKLFGLVGHSARLLIRDAALKADDDEPPYRLAWFQHHAEDEFTAGVYGTSKYDRTAIVEGSFNVRIVIEAADPDEMLGHIQTLYPALKLAELGHLPIGRGKWSGLGWIPWKFKCVALATAGDAPATATPEGNRGKLAGEESSRLGEVTPAAKREVKETSIESLLKQAIDGLTSINSRGDADNDK
jgi:CRISPR/Cas system CSM-associated protein Csm3 (group 7 of RAMP superfamily)